jgi:hypothetical protein
MPYRIRVPYTRLRNVQRVRRPLSDGRCNYHHYHRPSRTKLPGQPGSPEFMAVYLECERRLKPTAASTASPSRSDADGSIATTYVGKA